MGDEEGCGCGEVIAEILLSLLCLGIGVAVLSLFGVDTDAEWLDEDLTMLIGLGAIFVPAGMMFAVVHAVRKRKKKNIKKIEIYNKTEDNENKENDLDDTERKEKDNV